MTFEELEQKYIQIPQEIKDTRRWVCYKTEVRNGEETKIPMNALSGGYASTSDPATWTSFRLALSGCVKYNLTGLGFMLGEDVRTGVTYFGVDLDNHVDKTTGQKPYPTAKEFEEFAYIFINALNSYTEYSHSGEGVHIICKGKLPGKRNKRKGVEMYDYRRFFTMTGKVINNVPIADRTEEVKPLWEKYLNVDPEPIPGAVSYNAARPKSVTAKVSATGGVSFEEVEEVVVQTPSHLSDYELIERIRNSQQGNDFMSLYNGDMSAYGNDHSAADMAMCKILAFWTGCDADQMDRIFRKSALMREKWERGWGNGTYGSHTIESAIKTQRDVYTPPVKTDKIVIPTIKNENNAAVQPQGDIVEFDEKGDPIVKVKQVFNSYSLTDTGNAERFYDYFGDFFRYDTKAKAFMFWNGKTWIYDSKNYVKKYADMIIDILKAEIKQTEQHILDLNTEYRKKSEEAETVNESIEIKMDRNADVDIKSYEAILKAQRDNLKRVSNSAGKEAMIKEFQHLHEIPVVTEEFDLKPYLLNTDSGVVDLLTGKIMPFDRSYKLSKNTNCLVSYEEPKTWLKFLHDILQRSNEKETEELVSTIQLLLGDAITGRTNKDLLTIMYGNGSNGKSTYMKTIKRVFGDYGKQMNSELLLQNKNSSAQSTEFSFAALKGARAVIMSETNESEKMNDKIIKQLTSGETISAQKKFGDQFEYDPTFSPMMSTNNLPIIRSKDYGIWRRIFLIPFLVKFTDETKDIHMPEKLEAEMPKILGWIIQGCIKLNKEYKGVVPKPKCLEEALADYKNEMDTVNLFIASECEVFPGYKTSATTMFQAYKKWALDNNEHLMPEHKFKAEMKAHNFQLKRDSNDGWVYIGVKLNSDRKGHNFALDLTEEIIDD